MLLHLDIGDNAVHRVAMSEFRHGAMVESGWRVGELVWRKRLRMLRLETKRIDVLKVVLRANGVRVEAMKMWCWRTLASMDPSFRGW